MERLPAGRRNRCSGAHRRGRRTHAIIQHIPLIVRHNCSSRLNTHLMYENLRVDSVRQLAVGEERLGHTVSAAALLLTEQQHFDAIGGFACESKSTALHCTAHNSRRCRTFCGQQRALGHRPSRGIFMSPVQCIFVLMLCLTTNYHKFIGLWL